MHPYRAYPALLAILCAVASNGCHGSGGGGGGQVPDLENPTSGRYEDSLVQDLIPAIESDLLQGRVRY